MSVLNRLFPFNIVGKGSKIVLYGMGLLGHHYLKQIEQLSWCNVVGVMDRNITDMWPYRKLEFTDIATTEFDWLVVSIVRFDIVREVQDELVKAGVNPRCIITPYTIDTQPDEDAEATGSLKVLIYMAGGVGDAVMEICLYERLVELVPDIIIDIYGEPYCRFLYETKNNVRKIIDYHKQSEMPIGYDLILEASFGITIRHCNYARVKNVSQSLYEMVRRTELEMVMNEPVGNRVRKAQILGKDRFWLMGRGEIWKLNSKLIHINVPAEWQKRYDTLGLGKYITMNAGADMRFITHPEDFPTKVWPIEYFECLVSLLKQEYPEYELVQLGAEGQVKINGVDRTMLGEPFELVEFILRGATLHIDDEGGLTHLATALGTKCVVLFGPSQMDILGYPQNINICTGVCPPCYNYVKGWNARCFKGMRHPPCMWSITPEIVMEKVQGYLESTVNT